VRLSDPIFDGQATDTPELSDLRRDDRCAQCLGVRGNQKVIRRGLRIMSDTMLVSSM
jgi:hypothetical protein